MRLIKIYNEKGLPVSKAIKLASIPRSTYYSNLKEKDHSNKENKTSIGRPVSTTTARLICKDRNIINEIIPNEIVKDEIMSLFSNEFICYGYNKVTWYLKRSGYLINRKKVYRLMKELNILRPKIIKQKAYINRIKEFKVIVTKPNEVWEIDIKYIYIHGENRNFFICSIIDCFTREIISYYFGRHCYKENVNALIFEAINKRKINLSYLSNIELRIRSDNGCQFVSYHVRKYLVSMGIRQEHIHNATPEENGHIESFHSILQFEFSQRFEFCSFEECSVKLNKWVEFYNNERIHSAINYKTPKEFYDEYMKKYLVLNIDRPF